MHWILLSSLVLAGNAATTQAPEAATEGPIVLELFTSQGCSSCPSADRYLRELGKTEDDENLVLLAWHVDYWDYIGWADPYASSAYSKRQRNYARKRGDGRVYTPQLVVNGTTHAVGSDRAAVQRQIATARQRKARGKVSLDYDAKTGVTVQASLDAAAKRSATVVAVFFENDLRTPVESGENSGRTLAESYVVRKAIKLGTVDPGKDVTFDRKLPIDASWNRDRLGVAVLLQDASTMEIHGADREYVQK